MSCLTKHLVRYATNGTNLGLFKISFSTFWLNDLKKSQICSIWDQSHPILSQPWHPCCWVTSAPCGDAQTAVCIIFLLIPGQWHVRAVKCLCRDQLIARHSWTFMGRPCACYCSTHDSLDRIRPKVGQICPKWDEFFTLSHQILLHFTRSAKMYWNLNRKKCMSH